MFPAPTPFISLPAVPLSLRPSWLGTLPAPSTPSTRTSLTSPTYLSHNISIFSLHSNHSYHSLLPSLTVHSVMIAAIQCHAVNSLPTRLGCGTPRELLKR